MASRLRRCGVWLGKVGFGLTSSEIWLIRSELQRPLNSIGPPGAQADIATSIARSLRGLREILTLLISTAQAVHQGYAAGFAGDLLVAASNWRASKPRGALFATLRKSATGKSTSSLAGQ